MMNRRSFWVSSVWERMSSFCGLHQIRCCIIVKLIRSVHVETRMLGLTRQIWRLLCALHYDFSVLPRETHEHAGGRQICVSSFCTTLYLLSLNIFRHWSPEWHEVSTPASTGYHKAAARSCFSVSEHYIVVAGKYCCCCGSASTVSANVVRQTKRALCQLSAWTKRGLSGQTKCLQRP